jgi:hypothetical protein
MEQIMDLEAKESIAWQQRKDLGFLAAFWRTALEVLTKPAKFFDKLQIKDSYLEPLYFCMINYAIVTVVGVVYNVLLKKGLTPIETLGTIILAPIFMLLIFPLVIFAMAGVMHLAVLLCKGKGGFKGTFNILSYTSTTGVVGLIPYIGTLVNWIWNIVIGVIGYKRIHKLSTLKAVLAYCLPLVFFILVLLAAIAFPNFLKARSSANELLAKATISQISMDMETFKAANKGKYPADEYDLSHAIPKYLDKIHGNKPTQGYAYSLNLESNGYAASASPSECGSTGTKIFTIITGGIKSEKSCKQ